MSSTNIVKEESEVLLEETSEIPDEEKKPRKKVTVESHLEKYQKLLAIVDEEIEKKQKSREPGIRAMQTIRKQIKELEGETSKISNVKRKNNNSKKVSGFSLKCKITDELADFMKIPKGSTPTRIEITNAICAYAHVKPDEKKEQILKWAHLNPGGKRNLQDPKNKMSIIPDQKLKKLLGYDKYIKEVNDKKVFKNVTNKDTGRKEKVLVTDPILSYSVIQKLIQHQILETNTKKDNDFEILG